VVGGVRHRGGGDGRSDVSVGSREPGAVMLIGPDGPVVGSVLGGCVEAAVYELTQQVLADNGRCCSATG
jgi:xanthine/CO dehydrogenase XdhC/CoxF family maturation factor